MIRIGTVISYFLFTISAHAALEDTIVGLYANLPSGLTELGTGFLSDDQGQIVTAYHVIHGATKITAYTSDGANHPDIAISYIAPDWDLAVLRILNYHGPTDYLSFDDRVPTPSENLTIIGYPRGLPRQQIQARSTSAQYLSSDSLRNSEGRRLLNKTFDVVPLDGTIYSGMSGAPVIGQNGVLGILSGSFDEGGTIAWMIPAKYLAHLSPTGDALTAQMIWPEFDLLGSGFRSLSRRFEVDSLGEQLHEAYIRAVESYSAAAEQIGVTAARLQGAMPLARSFMRMALEDPSITQDRETAGEFLEYPVTTFLEAMEPYGQAHEEFAQSALELGNRAYELLAWAESVASSDYQTQQYLQSVDATFASANKGNYYEVLGVDPDKTMHSVAEFRRNTLNLQGGFTPDGTRQFVRGILDLIAAFEPDVATHASPEAISFLRVTVSDLRSISAIFEPLVYWQQ